MQKRITRYRYNPDTLLYEEKLEPKGFKYLEAGIQVIATIGLVCLYSGFTLPFLVGIFLKPRS